MIYSSCRRHERIYYVRNYWKKLRFYEKRNELVVREAKVFVSEINFIRKDDEVVVKEKQT